MSTLEKDQIQGFDALVKRNRLGRVVVYILTLIVFLGVPALFSAKIVSDWFNIDMFGITGVFVASGGIIIGIVLFFPKMHDAMVLSVETQRAFMTLDLLKAFFKRRNVYGVYGAGTHLTYWWEKRLGRNNISLVETSETFKVEVMTKTGSVGVEGSYRIRPRLDNTSPSAFLGGVAVIAEDVADLIKSIITEDLAEKEVDSVSKKLGDLNKHLADVFGTGMSPASPQISDFEARFGIVVGDVTAAEIILSDEAKKTRNAVDEALQFARGVALILGYATPEEVRNAITAGTLSNETIETARKQFLAVSENVTMDIKDWTFNIKGLEMIDPKVAGAVGDAARAYATATAASKGKK